MELFSIRTGILQEGDDLLPFLTGSERGIVQAEDILVISSKALATIEGCHIDLSAMSPSYEAERLAKQTGRSAALCEAVLQELERMNGDMKGWCPEAILTELKPEGMKEGSILIANAGLDESNVEKGQCIGWPKDPVRSVKQLKKDIEKSIGGDIAIILSDSCVRPGRMGVTACALCVSGIDPIHAQKGKHDLFGKPLRITMEAVADQLATAANVLMGNADQSIPFVLIRDHTVPFTSYSGWVSGIRVEEDIFAPLYT